MSEVWHEIRRRDDEKFESLIVENQPLELTVELIVDSALEKYKTAQYLADLHLKIAIPSDEELARVLRPHMEQREEEADQLWFELFKDLGKPQSQLVSIRYLHVSLLRGLAIEYLFRDNHSNLPDLEKEFKRTMHAALI